MFPDKKFSSDPCHKFPFFFTNDQCEGDTNHDPVGF